jgi:hypothetical protein
MDKASHPVDEDAERLNLLPRDMCITARRKGSQCLDDLLWHPESRSGGCMLTSISAALAQAEQPPNSNDAFEPASSFLYFTVQAGGFLWTWVCIKEKSPQYVLNWHYYVKRCTKQLCDLPKMPGIVAPGPA